jgi:hypothetical protein
MQRPKVRVNLVLKVAGQKPEFFPASTAGRVIIILPITLFFSSVTAIATARYVLPVPAGPIPKVITLFLMASIYVLCQAS